MRQDDERGQFVSWPFVIAIPGWVPESMCATTAGCELDGLAEGNGFLRDHGGGRAAYDAWRSAADPWHDTDRGRRGGRCCDKGQTLAEPARAFLHLTDVKRRNLALRDHDGGSDPALNNRSDDPSIGEKIIIALPENPVGTADLGFDWRQGFDLAIPQNIEIPPAGPVGTEKESAACRPFWLHDRFRRFASHEARGFDCALFRHIGDEELGAVPRHAGMIPGDPAKPLPFWRKTRRTQEIGTLNQDRLSAAGVKRQGDNRGLGVGRRAVTMILAHGEHAAAWQIAFEIGVAAALRRFDPARRTVRLDHPNAAIGALAENHDACRDRISAAAIFMDTAAHIERRRCQLFDLGIRPAAAQNRAAAFAGP